MSDLESVANQPQEHQAKEVSSAGTWPLSVGLLETRHVPWRQWGLKGERWTERKRDRRERGWRERERERERERQTDRQTDRQTQTQSQTDRQTRRKRETERDMQTKRNSENENERERETDRQTERDRDRDRQTEGETETERETERVKWAWVDFAHNYVIMHGFLLLLKNSWFLIVLCIQPCPVLPKTLSKETIKLIIELKHLHLMHSFTVSGCLLWLVLLFLKISSTFFSVWFVPLCIVKFGLIFVIKLYAHRALIRVVGLPHTADTVTSRWHWIRMT